MNKIEFVTSNGEHWYESKTNPGTYYPSATTILQAFPKGKGFERYLANQESWEKSQEILQNAGKRGTNVHKATEILESGGELSREQYTLEEWEMLMGFVNWHHTYNPRVERMEHGVVSDKFKVGGTVDRVYIIDGERVLLDIKTSSAIHESYWLQTSLYAKLIEEEDKVEIAETAILRLTDKRKERYEYKTRSRKEWKEDFKAFQAVKEIWDYLNPKAGPKFLEVPVSLKL